MELNKGFDGLQILVPIMTADKAKALPPIERRALLEKLKAQLRPIYQVISLLEYHCEHRVAPITDTPEQYYEKDEWRSNTAHCEGCSRDMGWYCPMSSDHFCHYEDAEECQHCGMPSERK
jgi:hypothetical protein